MSDTVDLKKTAAAATEEKVPEKGLSEDSYVHPLHSCLSTGPSDLGVY